MGAWNVLIHGQACGWQNLPWAHHARVLLLSHTVARHCYVGVLTAESIWHPLSCSILGHAAHKQRGGLAHHYARLAMFQQRLCLGVCSLCVEAMMVEIICRALRRSTL